jgi:hypothetical protein
MLLLLQGAFVDAMQERMLALGTLPEFVMFSGVEKFKVNASMMC